MSLRGTVFIVAFVLLAACKGKSEENRGSPPVETTPGTLGEDSIARTGSVGIESQGEGNVGTTTSKEEDSDLPKAPDFVLKDLSGNTHKLSDYRGKAIILDFWATYCPPCKKEIPHFNDLVEEHGAQGLVVLGIVLDGERKAREFLKDNDVSYPILLPDGDVVNDFGGIKFVPTTFVISPSGRIAQKFIGYRDKEAFLSVIHPYLTVE